MKFFLAYSRSDRDYASSLAAEIRRHGGDVIDPDATLRPGDDWSASLRSMIESAGAAILVLPRNGAAGANAAIFEAGAMKALGKPVYVVARRDVDRDMPTNIADIAIFDVERKTVDDVAKALIRQAG